MIIKGKSRAGAGALAHHLGNAETNERVRLLETRNTIAQDLRGALVEMEAVASGTRCQKSLYHAALSPEPPHRLTPDQRNEAIDVLEKKLGLEGHARVVVLHEKMGREHIHVVWSRIDIDTMKAVHDGHNFRKHEEVARELERRFEHPRVQGAHAERDGVRRPDRTPSRSELRQEDRTGIRGRDVKAEVTKIFQSSDNAEAFKAGLEERGYLLAQGDRRDFVVVDRAGGTHSLARRIDGVRAADLREFMSTIDRDGLPTADQAKRMQLERRAVSQERLAKQPATPALSKEQQRRLNEAKADHRENKLERSYGQSEGYAQQSRAALIDHQRRQRKVDKLAGRNGLWDRIEKGERERRQRDEKPANAIQDGAPQASTTPSTVPDHVEVTDAIRTRLDRLADVKREAGASRDGPGPQRGAPGGGRTRS